METNQQKSSQHDARENAALRLLLIGSSIVYLFIFAYAFYIKDALTIKIFGTTATITTILVFLVIKRIIKFQ